MTHGTTTALPELTALELERYISPRAAAEMRGVSLDTFRRNYGHIIEKMSPRRHGVKVRTLLTAEPRGVA